MNDYIVLRLCASARALVLEYEDDDGTVWPTARMPVGKTVLGVEVLPSLEERIRHNLSEHRASAGWNDRIPARAAPATESPRFVVTPYGDADIAVKGDA